MRCLTALTVIGVLFIGAVQAERRIAPVRPYKPVGVTWPTPVQDSALDAFRTELTKVARDRVYSELARITAAQGFFWARDYENRFDRRRPGVDNLALALRLEHKRGAGWAALERLAGEARVRPLESRPGVVCAPGQPEFDGIALDRLLDGTRTEPSDWAYTRVADVAVRAAPRSEAATLEILGLHFVRVLGRDGDWLQVAAPGGAVGFVAPGALEKLDAPLLCYGRDPTGRWQVAGYVGPGQDASPHRGRN